MKLFFLILWAALKRQWKLYGLVSLTVFLVITLFLTTSLTIHPNSLSEGIIGTYQESDLPDVATNLLSNGLVEMENGRAKPKLAASWEVNNDATEFKFKLKPNINWADGSKIYTEDLIFHIPDVEVSYPDSSTIQFKLKDSFSAFPSLLAKPIFKRDSLLGTGPYKVARIEKSLIFITKITLRSSDRSLPEVVLRFYPNEKTALSAFALGEVQSLLGISNLSEFNNHPRAETKEIESYSRVVAILYNFEDPVLGKTNRSIRQALSYSAPVFAKENTAKTPIQPNSWAYNGAVNDYLGNFEAAKQALGRARASMNPDDLKKQITLTVTPQLADMGSDIISAWEGLGLKAGLRVESGIPQNFQALLITQTIPEDPDQYFLWHSTQAKTNLTKYSSARVDKDLEDGRKVISEEDRKDKYFDFQRALLEDAPATFLYFPKYNVVYLKKAKTKIEQVLPLQLNLTNSN
jgi:ABC-type transport system substrate-binding protein